MCQSSSRWGKRDSEKKGKNKNKRRLTRISEPLVVGYIPLGLGQTNQDVSFMLLFETWGCTSN